MTISAVVNSPAYAPFQSRINFGKSWKALVNALRSGDLQAANQAYSALAQSTAMQSGPVSQLLSEIGTDLKTGNLSGAQQSLEQSQQPPKPMRHHHRHRAEDQRQPSTANTSTGSSSISITESVTVTLSLDISIGESVGS